MEGFWTVQFTGVQGWGTGVITFIDGRLFGGDGSFLYTGTYTPEGNTFIARVHVKRYAPGALNVMGRDEFDLELTGTSQVGIVQGNAITVKGAIPGTALSLNATLLRQGDLPART